MLKVTWLSGTVDVFFDVAVNQSLTIVEGSSLSLDEFDMSNLINVYPNPNNNGIFELNSSQLNRDENYKITIYNLLGKLVFEKSLNFVDDSINLKKHPKGIYFLHINFKNQSIIKKLIYL